MRCREIRPKPGDEVILKQPINSYTLPKGLEAGTKAKFVDYSYGQIKVEIEGKVWEMPVQCMEATLEYEVARRWYPAGHPVMLEQQRKEDLAKKLFMQEKARELASSVPLGRGQLET